MNQKVPDFSGMNIVVIGDVMLDQYIHGTVSRISPEAPVPILLREKTVYKAGGAANVALNIKSLGANPLLFSCIGKDLSGSKLLEVIESEGLESRFILTCDDEITTVKTRLIADSQHVLRVDEENETDISGPAEVEIINRLTKLLDERAIDAILFEDYNKGLLTQFLIERISILAKEREIFLSVDPKFRNFLAYRDFDLFKPNLREINQVLGSNCEANYSDLNKAADELLKKLSCKNLMITLGADGIYIKGEDAELIIPAEKLDIVDVCGAGDAVISIASLCLAKGLSLQEAAFWANKSGAEVCKHPGVVAIKIDDLSAE